MDIRRKIQFGAAAVIANGLLALTLMAPEAAHANPCSPQIFCACGGLSFCQAKAQPGCTATGGAFCKQGSGFCMQPLSVTYCEYN